MTANRVRFVVVEDIGSSFPLTQPSWVHTVLKLLCPLGTGFNERDGRRAPWYDHPAGRGQPRIVGNVRSFSAPQISQVEGGSWLPSRSALAADIRKKCRESSR